MVVGESAIENDIASRVIIGSNDSIVRLEVVSACWE